MTGRSCPHAVGEPGEPGEPGIRAMRVGFFLVLKNDPQHYLHAASLVREAQRVMPGVGVVQLTDEKTPVVPGCQVRRLRHRQSAGLAPTESLLLEQRLTHYASLDGEWLLIDTDVSIRGHVGGIFDDPVFDVALCDRHWPHASIGERYMPDMPFNTGVVFTRSRGFWRDVLAVWTAYPPEVQSEWMSEQRAVYEVVRTGRYRVKILPGLLYNFPPDPSQPNVPVTVALAHYKGPRKAQLTKHAYTVLGASA